MILGRSQTKQNPEYILKGEKRDGTMRQFYVDSQPSTKNKLTIKPSPEPITQITEAYDYILSQDDNISKNTDFVPGSLIIEESSTPLETLAIDVSKFLAAYDAHSMAQASDDLSEIEKAILKKRGVNFGDENSTLSFEFNSAASDGDPKYLFKILPLSDVDVEAPHMPAWWKKNKYKSEAEMIEKIIEELDRTPDAEEHVILVSKAIPQRTFEPLDQKQIDTLLKEHFKRTISNSLSTTADKLMKDLDSKIEAIQGMEERAYKSQGIIKNKFGIDRIGEFVIYDTAGEVLSLSKELHEAATPHSLSQARACVEHMIIGAGFFEYAAYVDATLYSLNKTVESYGANNERGKELFLEELQDKYGDLDLQGVLRAKISSAFSERRNARWIADAGNTMDDLKLVQQLDHERSVSSGYDTLDQALQNYSREPREKSLFIGSWVFDSTINVREHELEERVAEEALSKLSGRAKQIVKHALDEQSPS